MQLTQKDLARLAVLHPDLKRVIIEAARISTIPFTVAETLRSLAQQKKNLASHVSSTLHSRHIVAPDGLVYAADLLPLVGGKATYAWPVYYKFAPVMKQAAKNVNVLVEWGGDWKTFKDGPHWQLPWAKYPGKAKSHV